LQTRRLTEPFEGLDSSLAQSAGKLWSCKAAWNYQLNAWFQSTIYMYTSSQHVV